MHVESTYQLVSKVFETSPDQKRISYFPRMDQKWVQEELSFSEAALSVLEFKNIMTRALILNPFCICHVLY